MQAANDRTVAAVFHDVAAFEGALDALMAAGFDASAISILGSHQALVDHFGEIPAPEELADAPDTPRDSLDTENTLHRAIDIIGDTLATISEIGAAAAAYAVGGPVGIASGAADTTDRTVEGLLSGYVDGRYRERFEENVRDGGLVCWVHAGDADGAARAAQVLSDAGGEHVHETTF